MQLDHRVVALILLLTVSTVAVTFDILPVLLTAALTAFIWDFFFIPPRYTFHINTTEDTVLLIMYFIIAMVNAVLTYKIRQMEKFARKKMERANTIKLYNTMLNSLSHELRTPIAAIIAAADNLKYSNGNLDETTKHELVDEISTASLRLNQQVENLLNMSRLESGFIKPKMDWCDVAELIHRVVRTVEENSGRQNIKIHAKPALPLFKTDKGLLEQIVYNLVNNAAIHTPDHATIEVHVKAQQSELYIAVSDEGAGFPDGELRHVFDKFYRLKNTKASGTGLGLSIVKGFAEALHGKVQLENNATGGATFTLQIPAETSQMKL